MRAERLKALITATLLGLLVVLTGSQNAGASEEEGPKVERPKAVEERFDIYIHKWLKMPALSGRTVSPSQELINITPEYGRATVVVFLASYCEPCQEQLEKIHRLETKYKKLYTDFVYVFVNDSNQDAIDFAKEYKIDSSTLIHAEFNLLEAYKNPPLPSIYVGDRFGWIGTRYLSVDASKIEDVGNYLKLMTAI